MSLLIYVDSFLCVNLFVLLADIIKEQNKELRGTQRTITRDRAALEKQEKQLVSELNTPKPFSVFVYVHHDIVQISSVEGNSISFVFMLHYFPFISNTVC